MNVLFFSRLFYPHIGGVEKHVLEISRFLVKKGHSVTVLTEKFEKDLLDVDEIDGIKILRINSGKDNWFKKFRVWKNLWRHRKLIKKSDIIHAHDVFFWYLPFRFLYPSKKVFTTFHGYEGNKIPGFKSKLIHKIAEKLSKGNICVGDFLKKWYGTKPDYVTYGGVSGIQNSEFKIQNYDSKFKILFLGRLEEETGVMEYLKALKILQERKYIFEIVMLGDGSLRKNAEKFALENNINAEFKGFVENIDKYLQNCDFVFVSRYLGILEALAYGKFIFANYNNEIKADYLKMAPFSDFISISKNGEEISKELINFINHKKTINTKNGYNWVKDKTWKSMASLYLRLWNIK